MKINKGIAILTLVVALGACRETINDNEVLVPASEVNTSNGDQVVVDTSTNDNDVVNTNNNTDSTTNDNSDADNTTVCEGSVEQVPTAVQTRDYISGPLSSNLLALGFNLNDYDFNGDNVFTVNELTPLINDIVYYSNYVYQDQSGYKEYSNYVLTMLGAYRFICTQNDWQGLAGNQSFLDFLSTNMNI